MSGMGGLVNTTQKYYGTTCVLYGCNRARRSGHRYCPIHKNRLLFRGHPEQELISKATSIFAINAVKLLAEENKSNPSWVELMSAIEERWNGAILRVNTELNRCNDGTARIRTYYRGLQICYDIFHNLGMEQAFNVYCSWQWLQESDPKLFVNEDAFKHQMIRSLRNKAKSFRGRHLRSDGSSFAHLVPLYMAERAVVWEVITGIFGITGMLLHRQIDARAERLKTNKERIYAAIKHIK
ncbi:hypothetical protein [Polynucleobacter antarcticus]|uniref:Uncharacterized protein n=1 Tax=Polynucleobacter antarcticus TaxID=1743162 RepID=A0A6M9PQF8_9BURK|nr:hypothetical protein [Polynucleobacter antarcticus]QKM62581.1 hypothetical protein DCO16_05565 [Polynucleobacter antarcticus]